MFFLLGPLTIQEKNGRKANCFDGGSLYRKGIRLFLEQKYTENKYIYSYIFWAITTTAEQKCRGFSTWEMC